MNCKACGYPYAGLYSVCPFCGESSVKPFPAIAAPKKSCVRIPYLLLLGMFLLGTLFFILIPMGEAPADTVQENAPAVQESIADTTVPSEAKTLFQKDCFILEEGVLAFDESKFIANPILIVPAAIDNQPVEQISSHCFESLDGVTTIILPSSITAIGDYAFAGCADLRGVCVPNAVKSIGAEAFRDCTNLEAVYIPTGLDRIGSGAFEGCPKLSFVFYNGFYTQWQVLYPDLITPFTWVISWDGEYRHGSKIP